MIPLSEPVIKGNEWKYIKECLDTNWVSSVGKYVDMFEQQFALYLDCKRAVATVNGTCALHLALSTLGIGPGDEVIVSALTFIAPVNAIRYVGATPVFADSQEDTWNMDPNKIEHLITEKTKAIIPVHIYGHPVDMDPIMEIAKRYNLYVIEDATEALGSEYKGRKVGTIGHAGIFSFNGNKIITTGGGGMLVTNQEDIADRARFLCNQAKSPTSNKEFYHPEIGYNFRMTNILAAMGVAQLEEISEFVRIKRKNATLYDSYLKSVAGISVQEEKPWALNCYWLYSIVLEHSCPVTRDELISTLVSHGIECRPFFTPVNYFPSYKEFTGETVIADSLFKRGINLPSSVSLNEEEIFYVCKTIKETLR
jgi:perosamine synthetase